MRIFDGMYYDGGGWRNHGINFVDDDRVFVGFEDEAQCCEDFGWFFSKKPPTASSLKETAGLVERVEMTSEDLEKYRFDKGYFREAQGGEELENGGMVTFRLYAEGGELFLTLYNAQTGYYSHGFVFSDGDEEIKEGDI